MNGGTKSIAIRSAILDFLNNASGIFIYRISFLFVNILIAKSLGIDDFGRFSYALSLLHFYIIFQEFGSLAFGVKHNIESVESGNDGFFAVLSVRLFGTVLASIFVVLSTIFGFFDKFTVCFLLSNFLYFVYLDWYLISLKKFGTLFCLRALYGVLFSLFSVISLRVLDFGLIGVAISNQVTLAIVFISCVLIVWRRGDSLLRHKLYSLDIKIFKDSLFSLLNVFVNRLFQSAEIFLITFVLTYYELGIYSAPYRIIVVFLAAFYTMYQTIFPRFVENRKMLKSNKKIYLSSFLIFVFSSLAAFLIFVSAEFIILTVYDESYQESVFILKVLVWVIPFELTLAYLGMINNAKGRFRLNFKISFISLLIKLPIIIVFGFWGGLEGIVFSSVISYAFQAILFLFSVSKD